MIGKKIERPQVTLIAVGGGGLNIALDLIDAKIFKSYNLITYDFDSSYFEEIQSKRENQPLYFSKVSNYDEQHSLTNELSLYSEELLDWEDRVGGISKIIILCTTLGGKTGSSIAPIVGLAASLQGRFVLSVFSLPAKFEGEIKLGKALVSYKQLISISNISLVQDNNLLSRYENLKLKDMNLPILQSFHKIYNQPLHQLSHTADNIRLQNLIPAEYQQENNSLIKVFNNPFGKISFKNILEYFKVKE